MRKSDVLIHLKWMSKSELVSLKTRRDGLIKELNDLEIHLVNRQNISPDKQYKCRSTLCKISDRRTKLRLITTVINARIDNEPVRT